MQAENLRHPRGCKEACDLLEYANHPGGTYLVGPSHRERSSAPVPRSKMWCFLGNELDGPRQGGGHKYGRTSTAAWQRDGYRRCASSTRRGSELRRLRPLPYSSMPTFFGSWESTVPASSVYETVDYDVRVARLLRGAEG
jgi:alpha-N-arabinofuranosidase